ncbi:HNH endonuclease [Priestia aryabhattai]
MKNLAPPQLDANKVYQDIRSRSRNEEKKTRLENLEGYVFDRYIQYQSNVQYLENISGSSIVDDKDKKALESCYNRNAKGYLEGEVVAKIIKIQSVQHKNRCPYCGIDKPRTIDHYLPKSFFPEFSIYPPNLIPCCGHCNGKKNDRWIEDDERLFINLYYDELPKDEKFLHTTLIFNTEEKSNLIPTITFSLSNSGNINPVLFKRIESHYEKLGLLVEYSQIVEEEISNIYDKLICNLEISLDLHIDNLKMEHRTIVRKYGVNHWKASFLDGLINCPIFFERIYEVHGQ